MKVAKYLQTMGVYIHEWIDADDKTLPLPNHMFLNYYETGKNYIGLHSDKTQDMVSIPTFDEYIIISISIGATRNFKLVKKDIDHADINKFDLPGGIRDGDIVVMKGKTNACWKHCIPKTKCDEPRWSLTFRFVRLLDRPDAIEYV